MSYKEEWESINKQINELNNKRYHVKRCYQIESYEKRMNIIGDCYKNGNTFYKIIDLDIINEYRCFVLSFRVGDFDISDMESRFTDFINIPFIDNISDLGSSGISVESVMIRAVTNMEKISLEEFNKEYFNQCEKILSVDKFLLNDRLKKIAKEKEKFNNI